MLIEDALRAFKTDPIDIVIKVSTPARMLKKGNPYSHVVKEQTLRCKVNFDYEEEMSKIEGAWVSENRRWGGHVMGTCLITHKKVYYVQVLVVVASEPSYISDGESVPVDLLKPFLQRSNPSIVRDIKLSNIISLEYGAVTIFRKDKPATVATTV